MEERTEGISEKPKRKKNRRLVLNVTLIYVAMNVLIVLVVFVRMKEAASWGMFAGVLANVAETEANYSEWGMSESEVSTGIENMFNDTVGYTMAMAALFMGICAVAFILFLYFTVMRPLKRVQKSMRKYQVDKDASKVVEELSAMRSRNEIGILADDTMELALAVDAYTKEIAELARERERIQTELDIAKRVQLSQLPDKFELADDEHELDIHASMNPAKLVGGDFYDFFKVDDEHLALVIADVSDKGIPAAMFMMVSKALISSSIHKGESPAEALMHINRQLCERNETDMFVTVWLAVIELSTGRCVISNAGHEHPAVLRKGVEGWEYVKYEHSPGVAMWEFAEFEEHEFFLNPGDTIFVYTDGVLEAVDSEGEQYGYDRLINVLNAQSNENAQRIVESVEADISEFAGDTEQFDDITMLCFRYQR